jgi:hypothetical protein
MFKYIRKAQAGYFLQLYRTNKEIVARTRKNADKAIMTGKKVKCPDGLHEIVKDDSFMEEDRIEWAYDSYK